MKTRLPNLPAAVALCLALPGGAQATQILIDESFNTSTVPDGWIFDGENWVGHNNDAYQYKPPDAVYRDKTAADWFGTDQGFVELTEDSGWQRTTALYERSTFSTKFDFSISAEVRMDSAGNGADGMSFFWLDASSLDTSDLSQYQGGVGGWQGVPRGTQGGFTDQYGVYNSTTGFYTDREGESLRGYSFEFDHYKNENERAEEYNHMVSLESWTHMANMNVQSTDNPNYYEDVGWVSFELAYSAADKNFTYTYTGREPALNKDGDPVDPITVVLTPTTEQWTEFDTAYFGISAATGGATSSHLVRNLLVTSAELPGPGTLALFAFAPLVAFAARRRRR